MPFWELTVPASAEASEALANFLWEQGALGVVEQETRGPQPHLRAFFPDATSSAALCQAVSGYVASLSALGLAVDGGEPRVAPLIDEAWAEAWRQAFTPLRVGRGLLITPPWEVPTAENGLTTIIIEPGRAFGTGTHGSTRGCLVLLEALVVRQRVAHALDIGTGTGILAIAAAALGVPRVTALDTDPDAVRAASANMELNGVADRIQCVLSDIAGVNGPGLGLVMANLLAESHLALAPRYRRLLAPAGHLILGGILADEAAGTRDALFGHGFTLADQAEIDGWVTLQFQG